MRQRGLREAVLLQYALLPDTVGVLAVLLDIVECLIRQTERHRVICRRIRHKHSADGHTDRDIHLLAHDLLGQLCNPFIHVLRQAADILLRGIRREGDELISTDTPCRAVLLGVLV